MNISVIFSAQMKRVSLSVWALFSLTLAICSADFVHASDLPEVSPHTNFEPIPVGHFNRFVESIVARQVFSLPDVPGRPVVKGQVWSDWGGNLVNISGDINSITLRFMDSRPVEQESEDSRAPSFDLHLEFEDSRFVEDRMALFSRHKKRVSVGEDSYRVVMKHSRASQGEEMNGIRIAVNEEHENRIFYNGLDHTGVVVFIPRVPRTGFGGRALLVCPRHFDIWRVKRGLKTLEYSDYDLSTVSFDVNGVAQGRVGTGMGPGYARAMLQVSENITPSMYPIDESISNYPFVSVEYRAATPVPAYPVAGQQQVTAGLRLNLIHQNSFAHKTESTANIIVGIREMEVKAPLHFMYGKQPFKIEPGPCIAVLKEMVLTQEHSKEELPERSTVDVEQVEEGTGEELPGENLFDESDGLDTPRGNGASPLELLLE